MEKKARKKEEITAILSDLRRVLHDAVEIGIETNLEPLEMIVVSVNALWDSRNKRKSKQSATKDGPVENNVVQFRQVKKEVKNDGKN